MHEISIKQQLGNAIPTVREGSDNKVLASPTKSLMQMEPGKTEMLSLMESARWIRKLGQKEPTVVYLGLQLQRRSVLSF